MLPFRATALTLALCAGYSASAQNYAPPRACDGCHAEIAKRYWQSSMGRSLAAVGSDAAAPGNYEHEKSRRSYQVIRRDGEWFQRRVSRLVSQGPAAFPFEQRMTHVIGSGRHARTYLNLAPSGELTQLPLTWYSQEQRWAMSPGYDRRRHYDFARVIDAGCIFCHAAYPAQPSADAESGLWRDGLPGPIDCQRCHGPGQAHIDAAAAGRPEQAVRAGIVNPKRLPAREKIDVCLQCHLQSTSSSLPHALRRAGRAVFSFRPGERSTSYAVHFEPDVQQRADTIEINGHGYRLVQSACFRGSAERMTCTTCHDPHGGAKDRNASRREPCLACHSRHTEPGRDDCAGCHMPVRRTTDAIHVTMTDHRIRRAPPPGDLPGPLSEAESDPPMRPRLWDPSTLSKSERDYYLGLALSMRRTTREEGLAVLRRSGRTKPPDRISPASAHLDRARSLLRSGQMPAAQAALERAAEHVETRADAMSNLGNLHLNGGRLLEARRALEQALAFQPDHADALNNMGRLLAAEQDLAGALAVFEAAIAADPDLVPAHFNRGRLLHAQDRRADAIDAYRIALRLDPRLLEARLSLGVALGEERRLREAIVEFEAVVKIAPNHEEAQRNLALAREMLRDQSP